MEVRAGYKQTEVGIIPEEWDAVDLDAACSMKSGEGITAARIDDFSKYPCYGGNGLRGYTSRFTHDGRFALIGRQGALCGNVVGVQGKFFASEHAVVVTARPGTDIAFLTYVLGQMRLNRHSESSAQPGLSVSKVLKLPLAVPPTEAEQRAIATALSDVDALLGGLDRLIAKKRDLKQAAMQQLLTGQTRLPGFHGEWGIAPLRALCTKIQDGTHFSPKIRGGDFLYVTSKNIGFGVLDVSDAPRIDSEQHAAIYERCDVKRGDLLLTKDGANTGNAAVNNLDEEFSLLSSVAFLRFDSGQHDAAFFLQQVLSWEGQRRIKDAMSGNAITRLTLAKINNLRFPYAPLPEQRAIAEVLSDMDAELSALEARRDKTRDLKEAMMQELLTGKTRLVSTGGAHA
jgi:type I restriction enzyme, S subunit